MSGGIELVGCGAAAFGGGSRVGGVRVVEFLRGTLIGAGVLLFTGDFADAWTTATIRRIYMGRPEKFPTLDMSNCGLALRYFVSDSSLFLHT